MTGLRAGGPADTPVAVGVWRAALGGRGQRPSASRVAEITAAVEAPGALLVLAEDDGAAVGMAMGRRDGELLHLTMVYVVPGAQRRGVGAALVEGLADLAWDKGSRHLACVTPDEIGPVEALLEACGLERADPAPDGMVRWTAELEPPVRAVVVTADGLRLGQLLKLAGLVDTGSQAKALLAAGEVQVDGEVELRRGRQLVDGQVVAARDQAVRVVLDGPIAG